MKKQLINYALEYVISGLNTKQYAAKTGVTESECKRILICGNELMYPERLQQKILIRDLMKKKGYTFDVLSKKSGINRSELTETVRLKRSLTDRGLVIINKMSR